MKIALLCLMIIEVAWATTSEPIELPPEPTSEQVLEANGLVNADEATLLAYVKSNWPAAGCWLPDETAKESGRAASKVFGKDPGKAETKETIREFLSKLQSERLNNPHRVVDAALRKLGSRGTDKSIHALIGLAEREERLWVAWKAFASVQEILAKTDPANIENHTLTSIRLDLIAPLLRDLDPEKADVWAWKLWQNHRLSNKMTFNHPVSLQTRLWLASAIAANHPKEATEAIQDGLDSADGAIRMAAEMIARSGMGGSQRFETSKAQLLEGLKSKPFNSSTPAWDVLPLPLDRPLVRESGLIKRNLIWLDSNAAILKTVEDVWPLIQEPVVGGMYYSIFGEYYPLEIDLTDADGRVVSRFRNLRSKPFLASHGGFWATGAQGITEFHPDGSVLWQAPIGSNVRALAPLTRGRFLCLDQNLECRDRRGDLVWSTSLEGVRDARDIIAVNDQEFLISSCNSVGWWSKAGSYRPILEGLKSSLWVRYHPTEPWVILDGGDVNAIVFDPKTGKVTGRFDLDDGGGNGESRFRLPPGCLSN